MNKVKDYTGSVYGGLGQLLWQYCQNEKLTISPKLEKIQNLERFDYLIWRDVLTDIQQQSNHPSVALHIAASVEPRHIGVLGYLTGASENVGTALARYYDFHRLIYDGNPLMVEVKGEFLHIRWEVPTALVTPTTNEIAIAVVYQFFRRYLRKEQLAIHEVHFTHAAPKLTTYHEQYFQCPVRFNQSHSQLIIPVHVLSQPIEHADQTLQEILLEQAQKLLSQLPNSTHLDQRLQSVILIGLQQGRFQLEQVADSLQISPRQLQRHLQQQGTNYSQRLQEMRCLLAVQYLRDPHLSLHEISLLLGFSEQSAFQRAFRQWMEMTPKQWRKQYFQALASA